MFIPLWLGYVVTGTLMAVLTLAWALRTRQFDDQDRARYLPLVGLPPNQAEAGRGARPHRASVAPAAILVAGAVVLAQTLWVVLRNAR
jgi:nitrogen fixation-related uncharacterized protein